MISSIVLSAAAIIIAHGDQRIVDRVSLSDAQSAQEHGCAHGSDWTRCGLKVFDDTDVIISATLAGNATPRTFDLVVENQRITSYTFNSRDSATVELRVPLAITAGHTNILVMLRSAGGAMPDVRSLRSIQDHNE